MKFEIEYMKLRSPTGSNRSSSRFYLRRFGYTFAGYVVGGMYKRS